MPHFFVYLKKIRYRHLFTTGKDWVVSHVYNQVHDSMDEDILNSLESCGFIYLHDDHHDHELHHERHFQSFLKSLVIYLFTIKTIFFLCIPTTSKWTIYLGDFTVYGGGIRSYFLLYFLFWSVWTIFVMTLYHYSNHNPHMNAWLEPFVDLNEHFALNEAKKIAFFKLYKQLHRIFVVMKLINIVFCTISFLAVYLEGMTLAQFVLYGVYSLVFNLYAIYVTQSIFFTSHLILILIPYFVVLRFERVTEEFEEYLHDIEDLHMDMNVPRLNEMLEHYNTLCKEFILYNNFLRYMFGCNYVFITTSSCLLLYLVFFTDLSPAFYGYYIVYLLFTVVVCICIPTYFAIYATDESKSIYHSIFRLVMHKIPIKTKYNLVNIIEHQKDENLGFTLFTFFQINMFNFVKYLLEVSCMILLLIKANQH